MNPQTFCKTILAIIFWLSVYGLNAQNPGTLAERLGYPKTAKLLIIHADDLGVSHSENQASITAFEKGLVNSASVMVPCPWFPEVAAYFQKQPNLDWGIHLTLTSEWKYYKWKPVLPINQVPSLVNEQGFLYDNVADVVKKANPREIEAELTAQVLRAMEFGLYPTHLDSHMGTLFQHPEFFAAYLRVGRKFQLPVFIPQIVFSQAPQYKSLLTDKDIVVDYLVGAEPKDFKAGMEQFYTQALKSLSAGVTVLLIHTAYDDAEMQAVTIDHPDWGAAWRQKDFNFFTSAECKKILAEEKIQLITWKQIGQLLKK
jgi:chitin disaccharide deacetylase